MKDDPSPVALAIARKLCPDIGNPMIPSYDKYVEKLARVVDETIVAGKIVEAHQYLYYVEGRPIWSDYDYDMYCRFQGIDGNGGSDCKSSYTADVILLAQQMLKSPGRFQPPSHP